MDPNFIKGMADFHRASRIPEMIRALGTSPNFKDSMFDRNIAASAAQQIKHAQGLDPDLMQNIARSVSANPDLHRERYGRIAEAASFSPPNDFFRSMQTASEAWREINASLKPETTLAATRLSDAYIYQNPDVVTRGLRFLETEGASELFSRIRDTLSNVDTRTILGGHFSAQVMEQARLAPDLTPSDLDDAFMDDVEISGLEWMRLLSTEDLVWFMRVLAFVVIPTLSTFVSAHVALSDGTLDYEDLPVFLSAAGLMLSYGLWLMNQRTKE